MKYFLMSLLSLLTLTAAAQKEIDIADVANHVLKLSDNFINVLVNVPEDGWVIK
jgi:hypothetical protein